MSIIFRIFVVKINQILIIDMIHNFCTKYGKILEICKQYSKNLVNELGNTTKRCVVPKFSGTFKTILLILIILLKTYIIRQTHWSYQIYPRLIQPTGIIYLYLYLVLLFLPYHHFISLTVYMHHVYSCRG